jgi:multidrug efflux pump subunit AcrA (membrane-fusion protein)
MPYLKNIIYSNKVLKILIWLGILAFLGLILFRLWFMFFFTIPFGSGPVPVSVVNPQKQEMTERLKLIGSLQASKEVIISSPVSDVIVDIPDLEGQFVAKDTTLVELTDRKLRAPFNGLIGFSKLDPGGFVSSGTPITTIYDIDELTLYVLVPEAYASKVKIGQQVELYDYEDSVANAMAIGKVDAIDPTLDPMTRTLTVKVKINNEDHKLRPGQFLNADLKLRTWETLTVPESSLIPTGNKQSVYVVDFEDKVESREVKIGVRDLGLVEIVEGLEEGDKVIISGNMRVRPGTEVKEEG